VAMPRVASQPAPVTQAPAPLVSPTVQTPAPQPRRAPNLFSRVTGNAASWAKQAVEPAITPQMRATAPKLAQPAQPTAPVMQAPQVPAQPAPQHAVQPPAMSHPAPHPAPAAPMPQPAVHHPAPQVAPQMAAAVQPRLSGLDPKDRLATSRAEEDLLDIPAFLRRQAN